MDAAEPWTPARHGDLGIFAACCKLGSVQGCRELLSAGAEPNADAALSRTLTLEGFAPHAHVGARHLRSDAAQELTCVQLLQGQGQLDCAALLLAAGASLDARPPGGGASPLEVAQEQWWRAAMLAGSAAALCVVTRHGWSPRTHHLFPALARACAVALARLGHLLSRQPAWATESQAVVDVWQGHVMRHAVVWVDESTE